MPFPKPIETVLDFWRWGYSDLLPNITRGVVAEYLVAVALGEDRIPRRPWAGSDIVYTRKRIEVKSTAFDQTWGPTKGDPAFEIGKHGEWSEEELPSGKTGRLDSEKKYRSDVYVLCCLKKGADEENVLNPLQWEFWVFKRQELVDPSEAKKRITVKTLTKDSSVAFSQLRHAVDKAIRSL